MAVTATPVFVQSPKIGLVQIVNADASNSKTVVTAGANGSKVVSLIFTSNDTSQRIIQIAVTRSATNYLLGTFIVPTLAGTDGATVSVNALNSAILPGLPYDGDGIPYIFLQSGDTLTIASTTTVTSPKTVSALAIYGDF